MSQGFRVAAALAALAMICVWVGHAHLADELIAEAQAKEQRAERLSAYVAIHTQQANYYHCEVVVIQSMPSGRDASYGCYSRKGR